MAKKKLEDYWLQCFGGDQKFNFMKREMIVQHQHVNVADGGQAIVGNVTQGGGDAPKN